MKFEVHIHHHHHGCVAERGVMELLARLLSQGERIMSKISEFAEKQTAHNATINAAVDGLVADVQGLKDQITALQNSAGQITPEDQSLLDAIEVKTGQIAEKLAALDAETPPVVPASP